MHEQLFQNGRGPSESVFGDRSGKNSFAELAAKRDLITQDLRRKWCLPDRPNDFLQQGKPSFAVKWLRGLWKTVATGQFEEPPMQNIKLDPPTWFCKTKKAQPEHVVAYYKGDGQHRADGSDGDDTALQLALVEEEEEPVVQPEKKKAKRNAKFWTSKDLTGMEVFQDMLEQHTKRNPRLTPDRLRRMTIDAAKTQLPTLFPANMKHDTFKTFPQRICDIKKERAAKAAKEKKDRKAFKTMLQLGDEGEALGAAQRAAKAARRASSPP